MAQSLYLPTQETLRMADTRLAWQRLLTREIARIEMQNAEANHICGYCGGAGCIWCNNTGSAA